MHVFWVSASCRKWKIYQHALGFSTVGALHCNACVVVHLWWLCTMYACSASGLTVQVHRRLNSLCICSRPHTSVSPCLFFMQCTLFLTRIRNISYAVCIDYCQCSYMLFIIYGFPFTKSCIKVCRIAIYWIALCWKCPSKLADANIAELLCPKFLLQLFLLTVKWR